jgi:pimeloyl-ACP methyl ester carboxylesterase
MNRSTARFTARRAPRWFAALIVFTFALAAAVSVRADFAPAAPRELKGAPGIYEWRFQTPVGTSPFDQIGLHRVAAGPRPPEHPAAVVLFLPGTNMNGEVGIDEPHHNLMVYLATKGIDTWALDYRTHFIPPQTPESDLAELKGWTDEVFESDIDTAVGFILNRTHRSRLFVAGFSRGVAFAYLFAARNPQRVAGLIVLDGFIGGQSMEGSPSGYADDLGGKHLTFDKRKVLMQMVIANPDGPAPIPKYTTARENLEHVLYDSAKFGGAGGLANAPGGFSDAPTLARVLLNDDRWWPSIQNYENPLTPELKRALGDSKIPVIAFSSTNIAPQWPGGVRDATKLTGSPDLSYVELKDWGHLDVLCGTKAEAQVYAPIAAWITQRAK